jgi:hypothetical protein
MPPTTTRETCLNLCPNCGSLSGAVPVVWTPHPDGRRWVVSCEDCGELTTREQPTPTHEPADLAPTPPPAAAAPVFSPADRSHLATVAREMTTRTGMTFDVCTLPNCVPQMWSHGRTLTGESLSVQFLTPGTFWLVGRLNGRDVSRTGRYHAVGPVALAWVLSRILANDTTDPTPGCPGPHRATDPK